MWLQARYRQSLDPTVNDIKRLCTSLQRNANEERVLFHNGHGVPRPITNGVICVFNKVRNSQFTVCDLNSVAFGLNFYYLSTCKSVKIDSAFILFMSLQSLMQYIPLAMYDLQTWTTSPSIFVYDCSSAGIIVSSFNFFANQREQDVLYRYYLFFNFILSSSFFVYKCKVVPILMCTFADQLFCIWNINFFFVIGKIRLSFCFRKFRYLYVYLLFSPRLS